MTDVVLLHDADCPNVGKTREVMRAAFKQAGIDPRWREVLKSDPDAPREWQSFGSPTVLVDGEDVAGGGGGGLEASSCRLYAGEGGRLTGVPPVSLIIKALGGAADGGSRSTGITLGTALGAALAASACCLGPLVLAGLGVGGAAAFSGLTAYRPFLLGATGLALASAFHFAYRRPACASGACATEGPRRKKVRIALWSAIVLTALVAASPWLLARSAAAAQTSVSSAGGGAEAVFVVKGIDCEACAAPIRKAVDGIGGVREMALDVDNQTVTLRYESDQGRLDAYEQAIAELGYDVELARKRTEGVQQ